MNLNFLHWNIIMKMKKCISYPTKGSFNEVLISANKSKYRLQ